MVSPVGCGRRAVVEFAGEGEGGRGKQISFYSNIAEVTLEINI